MMAANHMQEEVQMHSAKRLKEMARDKALQKIDGCGSVFMILQYKKIKVRT